MKKMLLWMLCAVLLLAALPVSLAEEDVEVTDVILTPAGEGRIHLAVLMDYRGSDLSITLTV